MWSNLEESTEAISPIIVIREESEMERMESYTKTNFAYSDKQRVRAFLKANGHNTAIIKAFIHVQRDVRH